MGLKLLVNAGREARALTPAHSNRIRDWDVVAVRAFFVIRANAVETPQNLFDALGTCKFDGHKRLRAEHLVCTAFLAIDKHCSEVFIFVC
jgi:hypothetical protein